VRSVVARFLRRRGAEVVEAADGVEGLEQIALGRVDGVITDLRMPRMDGAQFHAALLQREPALAARLVMLSGDVMLFGDGADVVPAERVLLKPVEFKRLEAALVAAMRLDPRAVERAAKGNSEQVVVTSLVVVDEATDHHGWATTSRFGGPEGPLAGPFGPPSARAPTLRALRQ
jgi:CheY-like chemotaxis protein